MNRLKSSGEIYCKENTDFIHVNIENLVFICIEGNSESAAIIEKSDDITSALLEKLKNKIGNGIVKIISNKADFDILNGPLKLVFEGDIKFVNREYVYELYYRPNPSMIKASKKANIQVFTPKEVAPKIVKVLIVDDSNTICNLLKKIMDLSPLIEVVSCVNNPLEAEDAINKFKPDLITLDIHMPHMNGVELLKKIWPKYKIPSIMISSISMKEGPLVLEALESGAVDYIQKPDMSNFAAVANEINTKILAASKFTEDDKGNQISTLSLRGDIDIDNTLIVIGASTGGTRALKTVLDGLPDRIPPILIVQHIPAEFSRAFAQRLNQSTCFTVREAEDGDKVVKNQILIAPGGKQMKFIHSGGVSRIEINDDEPVNRFQPSVDYLFDSVSNSSYEKKVVAAIFTGMGRDGADGMKRIKERKGAITIAQDEQSCVVFGMPKEAIKLGCVDHIVPLRDAATTLMNSCLTDELKKAL